MWWSVAFEWPVVAVVVPLLVGAGLAVMSLAPPEFIVAKLCFTLAAVMLAARLGILLAGVQYPAWTRILVGLLIFGLVGVGWVESWRWVKGRQPKVISAADVALQTQLRADIRELVSSGETTRDNWITEHRLLALGHHTSHVELNRRREIEVWRERVQTTINQQRVLSVDDTMAFVNSTRGDRISESIAALKELLRDWRGFKL